MVGVTAHIYKKLLAEKNDLPILPCSLTSHTYCTWSQIEHVIANYNMFDVRGSSYSNFVTEVGVACHHHPQPQSAAAAASEVAPPEVNLQL